MTLAKFSIQPDYSNYTSQDGKESISTQLDGGAGRYRQDVLNASYNVTVSWTFTRAKYLYFRSFYKAAVERGSLPFLIDLLIDEATELMEYTAYFVPGSVRLSQLQGHMFKVDAQLEVIPHDYGDGYFNGNILLYAMFGEDMFEHDLVEELVNPLSYLITELMPSLGVFDGS